MLGNKKGMAMLVVIALVIMLLILGGAVLMVSSGHFGTSFHQMERARAFYAAEAAKQRVLYQLRTGDVTPPDFGNPPITVPFPDDINRIPAEDIDIKVEDINQAGEDPEGVHPIKITVTY